jgi:hypothetical protein
MYRIALIVLLLTELAHARPGELRPPRDATKDRTGQATQIAKPGTGEPPDHGDEVTYRLDVFANRDPQQVTHSEQTRPMINEGPSDRVRDTLLVMRPDEIRWTWYEEQDGSLCDHFGCSGGPTQYAAKLELVSIVRHHDVLPEAMHITAWPFLGVRRGDLWAPIPADRVVRLVEVRLAGDRVTIDLVSKRFPAEKIEARQIVVSLDELRARLEDIAGLAALKRKRWGAASAAFDRAIALDPALDAPHVHAAVARVALHQRPATLAVVAARNPVWLYWKVMSDASLASLRSDPAIRGLVVSTPGSFDPVAQYRCNDDCRRVAIEPTQRFAVAFASVVLSAEDGLAHGALRVIDRERGAVIATIPLDDGNATSTIDGTYRCAKCPRLVGAQRMLRDLGFSAPPREPVWISYLDKDQALPFHARVVFPGAKLELAFASDRVKTANQFVPITLPLDTKLIDAELIGDLVIYRWRAFGGLTDAMIVRRPAP